MKWSSLVSIVILLAAASAPAHAQVYKWVDEAGQTHYSDKAPAGGKKVSTVTDRVSLYTPDPSIAARAAATPGSDPALSARVDSLERQLQAERLARQYESAAFAQPSQAAYDACLADRRVDCDYGGMPYLGPIAVVPVRHRRPMLVRTSFPGAGNVVGPGIMPGTFNGPNAITAGNVTLRTSLTASRGRGAAF